MILSHKIELKPNKAQATYFKKACGISRFTYNWALDKYKNLLESGDKPNINELKKQLTKNKDTTYPWMREVTKCAPEGAFMNLNKAFQNFFKKTAKFPDFHKKGRKDSFYLSNDKFKIKGKKVRIPKLGWVKATEALRFKGKIMSATISRHAHKWFISISVEVAEENLPAIASTIAAAVGVDLGIKALATLSTGESFVGPKPLKKNLKKLKRKQRQLSRTKKGSKNREKAKLKLSRLHYRISCIRRGALDKLTTYLCKNFSIISIEDLATSNMLKNHKLARAISDMGWFEFRRQLGYKSKIYGNVINVIDRFEPTSKTCSGCGWKKEDLKLSDRIFKCLSCGLEIDRDLNAAKNVSTAGLAESKACGASEGRNEAGISNFVKNGIERIPCEDSFSTQNQNI